MADIAVVPTQLVMNTASADIPDAGGESIVAAATNVWAIAAAGRASEQLVLKFLGVASSVITILAGDRPPSQRAGLGDLTFDIASTDVIWLTIEAGRFLQDDGTIRASVDTGNTTTCMAFFLPKGLTGTSA